MNRLRIAVALIAAITVACSEAAAPEPLPPPPPPAINLSGVWGGSLTEGDGSGSYILELNITHSAPHHSAPSSLGGSMRVTVAGVQVSHSLSGTFSPPVNVTLRAPASGR